MNDPNADPRNATQVAPDAPEGKRNEGRPAIPEIGGTEDDPTRFGDWQHGGRVTDF